MEADIAPYSTDHRKKVRGKRGKKKKISAPKQKNLNEKNSRRYMVQSANANFGEEDYIEHLTYTNDNLPATIEDGHREITNYIRRVNYKRKKEGLNPAKYIIITEYGENPLTGKITRMHHHVLMEHGLDRKTLKDCWRRRRKKGEKIGEKIGRVKVDELEPDENGITGLVKYLTKYPNRKRRWTPSQNLEKPVELPGRKTNYTKRSYEEAARTMDKEYFEKRYPGWQITNDWGFRVEYNEVTGYWHTYLQLRKRE